MTTVSAPLTTSLEPDLKRMELRMLDAISLVANSTVGDRLRELIIAGGKRLRPRMIFHAASIFGATPDHALPVAAGIELLHTATLIHDDLVDHAQARRGVATLNSSFPMGLVVLSGDLLFAEAARLVAEADHIEVMRSFARALSEIVQGEIIQAQARYTLVSIEEYYHRIYGKTASLFRTAAEVGAMLGTSVQAHIEALGEYGRLLGMAFQIVDDTLDFASSSERLGKPSGHDLRQGVISLPVLLFHQQRADHGNGTLKRVIAGSANEDQVAATIEA
ncbi:MAG: polyprenyl synthetase family protein, partial [Anaerolineae bacterium]|nr:polyprenyl synthetase family protein [Anaerolineae bacterium]